MMAATASWTAALTRLAGWNSGLHEVVPEPSGDEHVEGHERHGLQHHPEDAEDDRVEQRPAEAAGRVGPDAGADDCALPEEATGECHGGVVVSGARRCACPRSPGVSRSRA